MLRALAAFLAAGPLLANPVLAATCTSPADQATFEVAALKSHLMVLATGCSNADTGYNAVVNRYKPQLVANDAELNRYFKRVYGNAAQREHDAFITSLANAQAADGIKLGSDFCPHDTMMFAEVLALRDSSDLPLYAAGKDLVPDSLGACMEPARPAPRGRAVRASVKQPVKTVR